MTSCGMTGALQRRLVQAVEDAAATLDAGALSLAGVVGGGRDLCLSLGYRGRHDGGLPHGPNDSELLERPGALQWIRGEMLPGGEP